MQTVWQSLKRRARRLGVIIMVGVVLVAMLIGWVSNIWYALTEVLVRVLGLRRVEEWLKRGPDWLFIPLFIPAALMAVIVKFLEAYWLHHGYYIRVAMLFVGAKVFGLTYAHYIVHLYAERLLKYRWIHWLHHRYMLLKHLVMNWLKSRLFYQVAVVIKERAKRVISRRRRSALNVAKRWLKRA